MTSIPTPTHCVADFCLIPVCLSTILVPSEKKKKRKKKKRKIPKATNLTKYNQIGTASPSVSAQIADVQRLIESSGVKYVMHSAGTTIGIPPSLPFLSFPFLPWSSYWSILINMYTFVEWHQADPWLNSNS